MLVSIAPPNRPTEPQIPPRDYVAEAGGWKFKAQAYFQKPVRYMVEEPEKPGRWVVSYMSASREPNENATPAVARSWISFDAKAIPVDVMTVEFAALVREFVAGVEALIATEAAIVDNPPAEIS